MSFECKEEKERAKLSLSLSFSYAVQNREGCESLAVKSTMVMDLK